MSNDRDPDFPLYCFGILIREKMRSEMGFLLVNIAD